MPTPGKITGWDYKDFKYLKPNETKDGIEMIELSYVLQLIEYRMQKLLEEVRGISYEFKNNHTFPPDNILGQIHLLNCERSELRLLKEQILTPNHTNP